MCYLNSPLTPNPSATTCLDTLSSASRCWGDICCSTTRSLCTRAWASSAHSAESSRTHTSNWLNRRRARAGWLSARSLSACGNAALTRAVQEFRLCLMDTRDRIMDCYLNLGPFSCCSFKTNVYKQGTIQIQMKTWGCWSLI